MRFAVIFMCQRPILAPGPHAALFARWKPSKRYHLESPHGCVQKTTAGRQWPPRGRARIALFRNSGRIGTPVASIQQYYFGWYVAGRLEGARRLVSCFHESRQPQVSLLLRPPTRRYRFQPSTLYMSKLFIETDNPGYSALTGAPHRPRELCTVKRTGCLLAVCAGLPNLQHLPRWQVEGLSRRETVAHHAHFACHSPRQGQLEAGE
jgi:hypothetical protein